MSNYPDLQTAEVDDSELIIDSGMASEAILEAINSRLGTGEKSRHIYTRDISKHGRAVQESFEKYLGSEALQSSHLKKALITPLHFAFSEDEDSQKLEALALGKDYFNLGTFLHQCVLEPTLFGRVLVEPKLGLNSTEGVNGMIAFWESQVAPLESVVFEGLDVAGQIFLESAAQAVRRTGLSLDKIDGKRAYLDILRRHSGIIPVTEENFLKIKILKKHLDGYADGIIYRLLKHSKREISFYHFRKEDDLMIKVRPDALQFKENIGVDAIISIKSTATEDLRAFYRHCAEYHYDLTEALYQDTVTAVSGRQFTTTLTVMLQTVEPYAVAILVWDKEDLEVGRYKYKSALDVIKAARQINDYPGYESYADNDMGIIQMKLPAWNNKELLPQR